MSAIPTEQQQTAFGIKLILLVLLLFSSVHYGAAYFGERYFGASIDRDEIAKIDRQIEAMQRQRLHQTLAVESGRMPGRGEPIQPRSIKHPEISDYIPREGRFLGADLKRMKLALFENGRQVDEFDILSKGRPGSHWETPSGLYEINTKARDHFSSIGRVHMPYSMQFYGNFFIHGWPYYPGGEAVEEGYSGGCIRMATEDAEAVYEFADIDTPIFVYDTPGEEGGTAQRAPINLRTNVSIPTVDPRAYLIADLETGDVFAEKNPHKELPIASVTKLMTAVVANETISFDKHIDVEHRGRKYVVGDLLYPLLLHSDNDVANSIAAFYGDEHFMRWMNAKAIALGMERTHFDDPSGLSANNTSTVADLFRLARYLYDKKQFILNVSKEKRKDIESIGGSNWPVRSHNTFADDPYFVGGKLGFTDAALRTSLSIFSVPIHGELRTVAVVVLGSSDWAEDSRELLTWLSHSVQPEYPYGTLGEIRRNQTAAAAGVGR